MVDGQHCGIQHDSHMLPLPAGRQQRWRRQLLPPFCCCRCCHIKALRQGCQRLVQQQAWWAAGCSSHIEHCQLAACGSNQVTRKHRKLHRCLLRLLRLLRTFATVSAAAAVATAAAWLLLGRQEARGKGRPAADGAARETAPLAADHQRQHAAIGCQRIGAVGVLPIKGSRHNAAAPQALAGLEC